ncbi:MAG: flagellar hook assembly protein FlgD [Chitinophagaceae bacterium]|nr:flagellar hook assembly protein FlgD [Rubrivivax sp.]
MSLSFDTLAAVNGAVQKTVQTANDAGSADRFLKLLVTQMQNQDPLNPMDNAQITSQMAQINTVSGIEQLNTTVTGLNSQFTQWQAMQGASLVGHDITLEGNRLAFDDSGTATAGFDLGGNANRVKVEVLSGDGQVVDTLELGTLPPGLHGFNWKSADVKGLPADAERYTFRVSATQGKVAVDTTPLMRDHVAAVAVGKDGFTLETVRSGSVPYSAVRAFI